MYEETHTVSKDFYNMVAKSKLGNGVTIDRDYSYKTGKTSREQGSRYFYWKNGYLYTSESLNSSGSSQMKKLR
jgi:hypothetical protein